jgi:hypothetical protein
MLARLHTLPYMQLQAKGTFDANISSRFLVLTITLNTQPFCVISQYCSRDLYPFSVEAYNWYLKNITVTLNLRIQTLL